MAFKEALVRYEDETASQECPYGNTVRVITGGLGGVANVHVIEVAEGGEHFHSGYDEVYYVLSGRGSLRMLDKDFELRPGAVAVIPADTVHSLKAEAGAPLRFVIFGTPAMSVEDPRFMPRKVEGGRGHV